MSGQKPRPFPVVGMGASAGGLDAFTKFFKAMPPDSGMAFVLIQHLDPTHESLTAELLSRHTAMSVVQVRGEMRVEPNHVYVIPPNKYLGLRDGALCLSPPTTSRGMRMPVDFFLRSLAAGRGERGIGIVLSGTGTDGTAGLKEIKAAGGLALVQDPAEAQYDGMPRSAISSGSVDAVVAVERMPQSLLTYAGHWSMEEVAKGLAAEEKATDDLVGVIALLRARVGFDFSPYKKGTLRRRIHRRMGLRRVETSSDYLQLLRNDPGEIKTLFKDSLISVSSFFREPPAWEILENQVLARIVAAKPSGESVRVWVPGCATGEEPYSIAMLLVERLRAAQKNCAIQIFASDVDSDALDVGRAGLYPESIASDVPPERLRRFFSKGDQGKYRINKELRELVIFAQQNLIADPPFSRLDLISCRNLLIYLEPQIQARLIPLFHFALADGGYLFLGNAETLGQAEHLFEPVSQKWRIYRRIGPTRHDQVFFPVTAVKEESSAAKASFAVGQRTDRLAMLVRDLLIERHAPATVVINRNYEILHFSGPTQNYLLQPAGAPTQDLLAQAREGLQAKLRGAVHRAVRDGKPETLGGVGVRRDDAFHAVRVVVEPLRTPKEVEGLLLVSFEDEAEPTPARAEGAPAPVGGDEWVVKQLEQELKTMREDLQCTIEELETANEELKAANEEVMSVNEELQSTNEELETSKEELQSLNEELSTLNAQLQAKVDELGRTNNDLDNLLTSTNIATVFLDRQFRIRRFTPAATRLFKLIASDVGRPLGDIVPRFTDRTLLVDAAKVLDKLVPVQTEVRAEDGRSYVRQALPYRTQDNRIEGIVITFTDQAAEALNQARLYAESIVDTVRHPLVVLDSQLRVVSANRAFYATFQVSKGETEDHFLYELGDGEWEIPELRRQLADMPGRKNELIGFIVERSFKGIGRRVMSLNARILDRGDEQAPLILLAVEDVTARQDAEEALRESEARVRAIVESAAEGIITIDEKGLIESFNPAAERIFGYAADEVLGRSVNTLMPSPYREDDPQPPTHERETDVAKLVGIGREVLGRRKDGSTFPLDLVVSEFRDGERPRFTGVVRDITERKEAETRERQRLAEWAHVLRVATLGEFTASLAHQLNQPLAAIANEVEACITYARSGKMDVKRFLQLLERASQQALRAGDILEHLRVFLQKKQGKLCPLDLSAVVRSGISLMQGDIDTRGIDLQLKLARQPLQILGDQVQIEQVILNLVYNGIEAIERAEGKSKELLIATSPTEDGDMAELTVADTGPGLSDEATERLFESFFTSKEGGLGMGLVISRSIVEAHHGSIVVETRSDGVPGTRARVRLPLIQEKGSRAKRGSGLRKRRDVATKLDPQARRR